MNDSIDYVYSFTCKLCDQGFKDASGIQDHLVENHNIPLEETPSPEYVKAERIPL